MKQAGILTLWQYRDRTSARNPLSHQKSTNRSTDDIIAQSSLSPISFSCNPFSLDKNVSSTARESRKVKNNWSHDIHIAPCHLLTESMYLYLSMV